MDARKFLYPPCTWQTSPPPGIADATIDYSTLLRVRQALRAVDLDIERTGTVSVETVELVRTVRAELAK